MYFTTSLLMDVQMFSFFFSIRNKVRKLILYIQNVILTYIHTYTNTSV